jgi:hypothetical protein
VMKDGERREGKRMYSSVWKLCCCCKRVVVLLFVIIFLRLESFVGWFACCLSPALACRVLGVVSTGVVL